MQNVELADVDQNLEIKIAQSLVERSEAWALVYRMYRQSSFISCHTSALHLTLLDLLPTTVTWNAYYLGRLVGTMSVVVNSAAGLPSGLSYDDDLRRYGIDGRHLCETTKFAIEDLGAPSQIIATQIGASVIHWCSLMNIDDVISVVHPRHAKMWTRLFGWDVIGEVKCHPGVNNRPGVLIRGDARRAVREKYTKKLRGERIIRRWQQLMPESPYPYRLSGSEAVMALLQKPELITRGISLQRTGFARHYPWASARMCSLLYGAPRGRNDLNSEVPKRERPFVYPNQKFSLSQCHSSQRENVMDRLLFLDEPLALIVSKASAHSRELSDLCEQYSHTAITETSIEGAAGLIQQHLFDYILVSGDSTETEIEGLIQQIRQSDRQLQVHTPIIDLNVLTQAIYQGYKYHPRIEQQRLRVQSLSRVLALMDEISEPWRGRNEAMVVNG